MNRWNLTTAKKAAHDFGCTLIRTPDGEFRVNLRGRGEASAAYETDLESAVGTAQAMGNRINKRRNADRVDGYDRDDLGESADY